MLTNDIKILNLCEISQNKLMNFLAAVIGVVEEGVCELLFFVVLRKNVDDKNLQECKTKQVSEEYLEVNMKKRWQSFSFNSFLIAPSILLIYGLDNAPHVCD